MRRASVLVPVIALGVAVSGCGPVNSQYMPSVVAPGELLVSYHDRFEISSPSGLVATGPRFAGLEHAVRCVPRARQHAGDAHSAAVTGTVLSALGGSLAVIGLGGLAGLAFMNKDKTLMGGLLGAGVGVEVLGLTLAGIGVSFRIDANGHAVDAVNYYNDAVGSLGGSCDPLPAPAPAPAPEPAPEPEPLPAP